MIPHRRRIGLALVLALALFLRLRGLGHDLPFVYDTDEALFVSTAVRMLQDHDPNPRWFGMPAVTTMYLLTGAYGLIYAAGRISHRFAGPEDYRRLYQSDPTIFYLSGRLLSVLFGVASVYLVYKIGRRLGGDAAALIAALVLAVSPLHVSLSQNIRMDALLTFWLLLTFWFAISIDEGNSRKELFLAGLSTGLAVITKWPGIVMAPIVVAACLAHKRRDARDLGALALGLLVGSVVVAPWLILFPRTVIANVTFEARKAHLSHTGTTFFGNLIWYLANPLRTALSLGGLLLAGAGVVFALIRRSSSRVLLALFPLGFLAFLSVLHLRWDRWVLPIVPFAALLAALSWKELGKLVEQRRVVRAMTLSAAALLVAIPSFAPTWRQGSTLSRPNTQTVAREWMIANLPMGARVLVEHYTPTLPFGRFRLYFVGDEGHLVEAKAHGAALNFAPRGSIARGLGVKETDASGVEFVVIGELYDRYLREQQRYPTEVERYAEVVRRGKLVYDDDPPEFGRRGPRIRIFDLRRPSSREENP